MRSLNDGGNDAHRCHGLLRGSLWYYHDCLVGANVEFGLLYGLLWFMQRHNSSPCLSTSLLLLLSGLINCTALERRKVHKPGVHDE